MFIINGTTALRAFLNGTLCLYLTKGSHARLRKLCWYSQIAKLCWYPHANKLLQKCAIFNKAINLHSRGPTEQYLYVWSLIVDAVYWPKKFNFTTL